MMGRIAGFFIVFQLGLSLVVEDGGRRNWCRYHNKLSLRMRAKEMHEV